MRSNQKLLHLPYYLIILKDYGSQLKHLLLILGKTLLNNNLIPKLLIILGFLWGIGNILTAIAHAFIILPMLYLVQIGAIVFAPAWGILEGVYLLSLEKAMEKD